MSRNHALLWAYSCMVEVQELLHSIVYCDDGHAVIAVGENVIDVSGVISNANLFYDDGRGLVAYYLPLLIIKNNQ